MESGRLGACAGFPSPHLVEAHAARPLALSRDEQRPVDASLGVPPETVEWTQVSVPCPACVSSALSAEAVEAAECRRTATVQAGALAGRASRRTFLSLFPARA